MRTIATEYVYTQRVCLSVCVSLCCSLSIGERCKNAWTNHDAVYGHTRVARGGPWPCNHWTIILDGVHMDVIQRIQLNDPCSATRRAVATIYHNNLFSFGDCHIQKCFSLVKFSGVCFESFIFETLRVFCRKLQLMSVIYDSECCI